MCYCEWKIVCHFSIWLLIKSNFKTQVKIEILWNQNVILNYSLKTVAKLNGVNVWLNVMFALKFKFYLSWSCFVDQKLETSTSNVCQSFVESDFQLLIRITRIGLNQKNNINIIIFTPKSQKSCLNRIIIQNVYKINFKKKY